MADLIKIKDAVQIMKVFEPFSAFKIGLMATVIACVFISAASANTVLPSKDEEALATVSFAGNLTQQSDQTVLTLQFDGRPDIQMFYMSAPLRLVLELEKTSFKFGDNQEPKVGGSITDVRFGQISSHKSRMVLTLAEPMEIVANEVVKSENSSLHSVKISLEPIDLQKYQQKIADQEVLLGSSGNVVIKGDRVRSSKKFNGKFSIVIDPGHGGIDGGATGVKGAVEKEITLQHAMAIGKQLEKNAKFDVHYTRTDDVFVSLNERQQIFRRLNADLLISIHADSLKQTDVRGATIYTLAQKASDNLAQEVADSENLADIVAGLAATEAQDAVTDILADLTLRETTHFSRAFSTLLINQLKSHIELINNPQRSASFRVLRNPDIPGVLLELGYLSNNEDEKLLTDAAWQQALAQRVAKAVGEFFANRKPEPKKN